MPFTYSDLIDAAGNMNRGAFDHILAANTAHEINITLCCYAGVRIPSDTRYRDVRRLTAELAATVDQNLITDQHKAEIENSQRNHLLDMIAQRLECRAIAAAQIADEDARRAA